MDCQRIDSRSFDEEAAELPVVRATRTYPFERVGIDFAEPFYYRNPGEKRAKNCLTCGAACAAKQRATAKQTQRPTESKSDSDHESVNSEGEEGEFNNALSPRTPRSEQPSKDQRLGWCSSPVPLHAQFTLNLSLT